MEAMKDYKLKQVMTLGEPICQQLKRMYYANRDWIDCYRGVAAKFTQLKDIMRKFYTGMSDFEVLVELQRYSAEDLQDVLCETIQTEGAETTCE
jgi:hypothetical protein